jgi:hypothetical protein
MTRFELATEKTIKSTTLRDYDGMSEYRPGPGIDTNYGPGIDTNYGPGIDTNYGPGPTKSQMAVVYNAGFRDGYEQAMLKLKKIKIAGACR